MKYFYFLLFFFGHSWMEAQSIQPEWLRNHPNAGSRIPMLCSSVDGNIIMAAETYSPGPGTDLITFKYTPDGDLLWTTTFVTGASEQYWDVEPLSDGSLLALCESKPFPSLAMRAVLIKYSASGDTLWQRSYEDSLQLVNRARDIVVDAQGQVFLIGEKRYTTSSYSILWVAKIDPQTGDILWSSTMESAPYDHWGYRGKWVQDTLVVWGLILAPEGIRFVESELLGDGSVVSLKPPAAVYPNGLNFYEEIDNKGNLLVSNYCCTYSLFKYSRQSGEKAWEYSKSGRGGNNDAVTDENNNIYICGFYEFGDSLGRLPVVSKLSESGNLIWENYMLNPYNQSATFRAGYKSAIGFTVVGAFSTDTVNNFYEYAVVNYSEDGSQIWGGISEEDGEKNLFFDVLVQGDCIYAAGKVEPLQTLNGIRYRSLVKYKFPLSGTSGPDSPWKNFRFSVSPSPFQTAPVLTVEGLAETASVSVCITTLQGVEVFRREYPLSEGGLQAVLPLPADLPPGPYAFTLRAGGRTVGLWTVKTSR